MAKQSLLSDVIDIDDRAPPSWQRLAQATWLPSRFYRGFGSLGPLGPENGPPALVIPGFLASDRTCMELRRSLAASGWRVHGWGMGFNTKVEADLLDRLEAALDRVKATQPVLLVGWSLGGLYARELARRCPDRVRAVVTLGAPFSGHKRQNNVWPLYEMIAGHSVDETPLQMSNEKPPVPTLALWSRRDGVIAPRSAYGLEGERDKAVETNCRHMAFSVSRKATRLVAREIDIFLEEVKTQQGKRF